MEILLALLYPAGFGAIVVGLFTYLRSQEGQRSVKIAQSNLTPVTDIESGYAAVAASMKALRRAKQEEHQILMGNWQNSYLELLPATDPEKTTHQAQLQGVKIETARFSLDSNGMKMMAGTITAAHLSVKNIDGPPVIEDGPEWSPLPYKKTKKDPDAELSYGDRRIQRAGAFVRTEPRTDAAIYGVATGGDIVHFDGYVHGEAVNGNTVWFVYIGQHSGLRKYVHSVATTNHSTSGMANLTNNGNLDPDQRRQLERTPAIVRNYQEDQRKKYDPTPKTKIPSTMTKVWY